MDPGLSVGGENRRDSLYGCFRGCGMVLGRLEREENRYPGNRGPLVLIGILWFSDFSSL